MLGRRMGEIERNGSGEPWARGSRRGPGGARQALEDGSYAHAARADEDQASALGITGVPFCVLDGRLGVSGAQPAQTFERALQQAWASR
jgi:predicted DsbA family dithiol-disulfide isomerase